MWFAAYELCIERHVVTLVTLGCQKSKFWNFFFDIVTIHNDHPSNVEHVLGRIYVFLPNLGIWCGGGGGDRPVSHLSVLALCGKFG